MNLRRVMYVVIVIVCIWSIAIGVYDAVNGKMNKRGNNQNNVTPSPIIPNGGNQDDIETQETLRKSFNEIFNNQFEIGQYNAEEITKNNSSKDLVYTYAQQEKTDIYEIEVNFPIINIKNENISKIMESAQDTFIKKGNEIIDKAKEQTVYSINYAAYINENVLSVIIKSSLKEGSKPQKIVVKAYNINLDTLEMASINDLCQIRKVDKSAVEEKISETITEAIKEASKIQETGYDVYVRDLRNSMYEYNNLDTYFLDSEGALNVIFAYGNYDYTAELDIVKV